MSNNSSTNPARLCQSSKQNLEDLWISLQTEATELAKQEPALSNLLHEVFIHNDSFSSSLSTRLSRKLAREDMSKEELYPLLKSIFDANEKTLHSVASDMKAIFTRDPACNSIMEPMLFFKGFMALTVYRVAHYLWTVDRRARRDRYR